MNDKPLTEKDLMTAAYIHRITKNNHEKQKDMSTFSIYCSTALCQ